MGEHYTGKDGFSGVLLLLAVVEYGGFAAIHFFSLSNTLEGCCGRGRMCGGDVAEGNRQCKAPVAHQDLPAHIKHTASRPCAQPVVSTANSFIGPYRIIRGTGRWMVPANDPSK